jgi:hypothetical protein
LVRALWLYLRSVISETAITWKDVVMTARKGHIKVSHGKGRKYREVPLNKTARNAFISLGYEEHVGNQSFIFVCNEVR